MRYWARKIDGVITTAESYSHDLDIISIQAGNGRAGYEEITKKDFDEWVQLQEHPSIEESPLNLLIERVLILEKTPAQREAEALDVIRKKRQEDKISKLLG